MSTPLEQLLKLLDEDLADSQTTIGDQPGPLPAALKSAVAADLNNARGRISSALTAISNAGSADTSNLPSTLPAIAAECVNLASAALAESKNPQPDNTSIGNDIKTIDRIITVANGYRSKAGIT